jgi:hypothetical protein
MAGGYSSQEHVRLNRLQLHVDGRLRGKDSSPTEFDTTANPQGGEGERTDVDKYLHGPSVDYETYRDQLRLRIKKHVLVPEVWQPLWCMVAISTHLYDDALFICLPLVGGGTFKCRCSHEAVWGVLVALIDQRGWTCMYVFSMCDVYFFYGGHWSSRFIFF